MPREVTITVCQYLVREISSFEDMAARVRALLDQAGGSDIAIFPELFTIELFTTLPAWRAFEHACAAAPTNDATLTTRLPVSRAGTSTGHAPRW